jgi:hypothetical protein
LEVTAHRTSMAAPDLSFGERRFRKSYNLRLALAMLSGALLYADWVLTGEPPFAVQSYFFWTCVAAVLFNGAGFIAIGSFVLTLSDQGIRRESLFGVEEIPWDQVRETRYRARPVRPPLPKGLFGVLLAAARKPPRIKLRLKVVGNTGEEIKITESYRRAREAMGIVLGRIIPPMAASVHASLSRGETVFFGDLALSSTGVAWKRRPAVPLAEITRAEIVGRNLQIRSSGKWLSALKVRSDRIPNVLVFLEVLETMAPQLRPARMDPLARVRL